MSAAAMSPRPLPSLDYGVGAGVALLLAGLIGLGLARAGSVPLTMDVYGELGPVSRDELQSAAAPLLAGGFFRLNARQLEARLMGLPWVRGAEVQRLWPDRVALQIVPHEALARWGEERVLTTGGAIIVPREVPALTLTVEAPDAERAAVHADLGLILPSLEAGWQLERWTVSRTGDRQAELAIDGHRIRLEFGREPVAEKFALLADVVMPILKERREQLAAVDLRYRNGFAVRWREGQGPGNE